MKNKIKIIAILALLCWVHAGYGQNLSNTGKEFWVGYGHHQFMEAGQNNSQEMVLYLSAEQAANVTVTVDGTAWIRNYAIPANTVRVSDLIPKAGAIDARLISLPCSFVPPGSPCGGEGIFINKGIHIVSDVPIVAYAHIYGSQSSGATMLMPVTTWGYAYTTLNSKQSYSANCFSWVYVIAKDDNTVIEVTPAAVTRSFKPANVPFIITLMKGQIYQLMAGPEAPSVKPEMSGTKVRSIANATGNCYPIAVFAGSSRTSNPASCGSGGGDNDNQQCFPSQAWGKRYLTSPTSSSGTASTFMTNTYKIAVKDPTTVVKRNGTQIPLANLINNTYYTYESSTADYMQADKPIMVAQYMTGGSCLNGGFGDPEMMYISPIEQGIKRIGFYRNTQEAINVNYLTLIIPTPGVSSLTIDGSSAFTHTYVHPNLPGYTVVVKRWTSATAQAIAMSDSAFTAITYGLGQVESYGYNAGTLINNLNAIGSIFNSSDTTGAVTSHPFTCDKTPMRLSVLLAYPATRLVWQLSQVGPVLSPNTDVIDNAPVPVGAPILINGVPYYKFTLPGTYTFNATGTYTIPLLATHPSIENCNNTESVSFDVIVNGKPLTDFTYIHTGCILDTVQFNSPATSSNGFNLNQWLWTYPDATTSNIRNPRKLFNTIGPKNVKLRIVSAEGCVSDTTKTITIFPKPVAGFGATPANVCQGDNVTFNTTSTYTGPAPIISYYWDFDNSPPITVPTSANQIHAYPAYGTYIVSHVASVSATCPSDTVTRVVRVYAKPTTTFTYPAGCLPAGGAITFSSSANAPDGQAITGHSWNFGDPGSGAANTSTLASPTHVYSTFGTYTITYSVTTANGCTKDTTITATFNIRPTLAYPALAAVCQNVAPFSVATASVTNGVTGSGVYHGPATTLAGIFNPTLAGTGTHTIWYVFSTSGGCVDSISQSIIVRPKVAANFVIPTAACLPVSGNVQFNYSGTVSAGQQYLWNFGDPASGVANTSAAQNPTHNYSTGNYTINLTVTSLTGCVDDTVMTTNFTVRPALAYPPLPGVCVSIAGTVSVATGSVTNGVPGTGVYHGPATTLSGNFNPSVAGAGTHTIWYVFTATGNCVDSISRTIVVYAKPAASFNFTSAACLPTTGLVQFTYNGSLSAGQTYLWNFGDPPSGPLNTSTLQNPTHNYSNTGSHTLSVTVTNSNGCIDDTTIIRTFSVKPALAYPALTAICQSVAGTVSVATATVTNGVTGTGVYQGPGTNAAGNFSPSMAGPGTHTIWYVFTSTGNCVDSISRTIVVYAKPSASFNFTNAACLPTTGLVQFTYNGSLSVGQTYLWNFGDPASGPLNTSTLQNPTHNYSNTGSHTLTVTVTNSNGCTDDSTIIRTFSVKPALAYPALTAVCQSVAGTISVATATVTNGVSGTGVYQGPGTNAAGNFSPSLAGPGTHTIKYIFTSTGNCIDSISRTIVVYPKPTASFSIAAAACLPTNGFVQFTYNGSVSPGQTYLWNFGDPPSGPLNTSAVQSPSHNYSNTGSHNIKLTVTGTNTCFDDTVVVRTFSVKPALAYPALTAICQNAGSISVATATVTNGVEGTGVYSGPGTNAAGNFNPATAGPGTWTIWYVFTSTGNCKDSISRQIVVNPKPTASFNATASICQNQQALISNISSGSINTWKWNFGNGTTATYNNNTAFSKSYATFGNYTVKLVTVSTNGCNSDPVTRPVAVHSMPKPDFTMPASVCLPGTTNFSSNPSVSPDGSSLTYLWNFGDPGSGAANTSTAISPGHVYVTGSSYNIKLTATSSFGCVEDTIKAFSAFFDKPIARFDVSPDSLCQGSDNVFTNLSVAPNSSIQNYLWTFGDGTNSQQQNPIKRYVNPGTYEVNLKITSNENCVSDSSQNVVVYLQPKIDAGLSFFVPQGTVVQFKPTVNDSSVLTFVWSPSTGLSNAMRLRPTLQANIDQTYTLTATGPGKCTARDTLSVKIYKPIKIPNAFSPNADVTNDTWIITNITDYPAARVEVFNRYGQMVFNSVGYTQPWDGTFKGKPLPVATYYYVINLNNDSEPLTGSITIIR